MDADLDVRVLDLGGCSYLAVISGGVMDSGAQPTSVDVFQFMATEPLYKVLQAFAANGGDVDRVRSVALFVPADRSDSEPDAPASG